jgi:hypothetical protein
MGTGNLSSSVEGAKKTIEIGATGVHDLAEIAKIVVPKVPL